MKSFLLLFILLPGSVVFAESSNSKKWVDLMECKKSFLKWEKVTFTKKLKNDWKAIVSSSPEVQNFRRASAIGIWYEVELDSGSKTTKVYQLNPGNEKVAELKADCSFNWSSFQSRFSKRDFLQSSSFNDQKLTQIIDESKGKGQRGTLIYIWSPAMVYSMNEAKVISKIAADLKLNFVPIVDSRYTLKQEPLRKLAQSEVLDSSLSQNSFHLLMLEGEDHFPSVFLVKNGRLSEQRIPGIMPSDKWRKVIQKWLSKN